MDYGAFFESVISKLWKKMTDANWVLASGNDEYAMMPEADFIDKFNSIVIRTKSGKYKQVYKTLSLKKILKTPDAMRVFLSNFLDCICDQPEGEDLETLNSYCYKEDDDAGAEDESQDGNGEQVEVEEEVEDQDCDEESQGDDNMKIVSFYSLIISIKSSKEMANYWFGFLGLPVQTDEPSGGDVGDADDPEELRLARDDVLIVSISDIHSKFSTWYDQASDDDLVKFYSEL